MTDASRVDMAQPDKKRLVATVKPKDLVLNEYIGGSAIQGKHGTTIDATIA
jgi:hypothetical protein